MDLKKIAKKLKTFVVSDKEDVIEFVSTGNASLDLCLDGGVPFGYVTELIGLSRSGKSLLLQQVFADAQQSYGAICILADRENAYFPRRGKQLGIDNSKLIIAKPNNIPTVLEGFMFIINAIKAIREEDEDTYIVIGVDSISGFGKDTSLDKGDSGRKAKSTHEGLREVLTEIDSKTMLIICNQITYKIGVLYGDPTTTTAGESMKYYSTVRIALEDKKRIIDEKRGNEVVGNWIGAEIIKTRLGPAHRTVYLRHLYKTGIDYYSGYARLLVDRGYLKPKNKDEFKKFKQVTVKYKDREINEHDMQKIISEFPELKFDEYPEYNIEKGEEE